MWHANDEEGDEECGAEEGGCEAGSGVEMGYHGRWGLRDFLVFECVNAKPLLSSGRVPGVKRYEYGRQ